MRRIAFRRLLPITQLVLFLALMWMGLAEEKSRFAGSDAMKAARGPAAKLADEEGWDLRSVWDHYIPAPVQIAFAINVPAIVLAIPAALLLAPLVSVLPFDASWLFYLSYAAGVLVFWRLVGVWLDRRRNLVPPRSRPIHPTIVGAVAALFVPFCLLMALSSTRHYPILAFGFLLWAFLVAIA